MLCTQSVITQTADDASGISCSTAAEPTFLSQKLGMGIVSLDGWRGAYAREIELYKGCKSRFQSPIRKGKLFLLSRVLSYDIKFSINRISLPVTDNIRLQLNKSASPLHYSRTPNVYVPLLSSQSPTCKHNLNFSNRRNHTRYGLGA